MAPVIDLQTLRKTLAVVLERTASRGIACDYRLVGTSAALFHGVDLPARDIDILVPNRDNVDAFVAALEAFETVSAPSWLTESRQYFANIAVDGIEVEFSTVEIESEHDTIEAYGPGPWLHYSDLRCATFTVPTVALELRLHTDLHRDRPSTYEPIISFLTTHGCNHELLHRCIDRNCNLASDVKERVRALIHRSSNIAE